MLSDAGVATKKIKGELAYFEFENLLEPFVGRLMDSRITLADGYYMGSIFAPVLETLDKARLNPDQIDAVLLNGASCRNPLVVRAFQEFDTFRNAEILAQGDLDLAVARGAAVRCFYKHYQDYDPITPIVNAELGLITHGDKFETLVESGTRLPFQTIHRPFLGSQGENVEDSSADLRWQGGQPAFGSNLVAGITQGCRARRPRGC
jgi:molecular chaperone DnaK (HSP70)